MVKQEFEKKSKLFFLKCDMIFVVKDNILTLFEEFNKIFFIVFIKLLSFCINFEFSIRLSIFKLEISFSK